MLHRRRFLQGSLCLAAGWLGPRLARAQDAELAWHDVTTWGVEGRGWTSNERKRYFDRLPAKAEGVVRKAVWDLSRHSAGMAVRFRTDATNIHVDYQLLHDKLAMPHMPATGVSGIDLYGQAEDGTMRWVQVVRPTKQSIKTTLVRGLDPGDRQYIMYLPLYNGVESLKIGVPEGSSFEPLKSRDEKPILFYGTSIMHGACASRPGMAIPALVGRRFNRPTINLGFSGNGRMEKEVAELLAELDPEVYCIDCLPNMNADLVRQRAAPLVRILRTARPTTPIVLVEDRVFTNATFFGSRRNHHKANHQALRETFETLEKEGVKGIFYLPADELLGTDGEAATDGSHPNDLGFVRYARAYEKVLAPLF